MNHRSLLVLVIAALLAIVGCSVSPDETFPPSGGGSTATGGQGGVAGQGGQGGVAGQGGQTSTGGQGGVAGQGGQGGAPEFFSCAGVAEGHLVVKVAIATPSPAKYFAWDGVITFDPATGLEPYPADLWGPLYVSPDKGPHEVTADVSTIYGDSELVIPPGSQMVFAPGWSVAGDMDAAQIVDNGFHSCEVHSDTGTVTCQYLNMLCCYGTVEVARQMAGDTGFQINNTPINGVDHFNLACIAPSPSR